MRIDDGQVVNSVNAVLVELVSVFTEAAWIAQAVVSENDDSGKAVIHNLQPVMANIKEPRLPDLNDMRP
jgi:hypothetical protein